VRARRILEVVVRSLLDPGDALGRSLAALQGLGEDTPGWKSTISSTLSEDACAPRAVRGVAASVV